MTYPIGFPEAAARLGVPLRILRAAIRAGRIPAPANQIATATLTPEWLATAQTAVETTPHILARITHQKVPPFARYKGTSCWRKHTNRVREYNRFHTALNRAD